MTTPTSKPASLIDIISFLETYPNVKVVQRNKRGNSKKGLAGYTGLFLSLSQEKKFRYQYDKKSPEEEGWISVGAGWATVSTIWDERKHPTKPEKKKTMIEKIKHYQPVIDYIKPVESGWHRCPTNGHYHSSSAATTSSEYNSRWAKDLTKANYREVLALYITAIDKA